MVQLPINVLDGSVDGKTICVLGVTFKPNTDDMRDAPSLTIIPKLLKLGAKVRVFDPEGKAQGKKLLEDVLWLNNSYDAAEGSELIVLLTEWNEFRALDLAKLASVMHEPRMADLRNIYSKEELLKFGFTKYIGVGR